MFSDRLVKGSCYRIMQHTHLWTTGAETSKAVQVLKMGIRLHIFAQLSFEWAATFLTGVKIKTHCHKNSVTFRSFFLVGNVGIFSLCVTSALFKLI